MSNSQSPSPVFLLFSYFIFSLYFCLYAVLESYQIFEHERQLLYFIKKEKNNQNDCFLHLQAHMDIFLFPEKRKLFETQLHKVFHSFKGHWKSEKTDSEDPEPRNQPCLWRQPGLWRQPSSTLSFCLLLHVKSVMPLLSLQVYVWSLCWVISIISIFAVLVLELSPLPRRRTVVVPSSDCSSARLQNVGRNSSLSPSGGVEVISPKYGTV